MPLVLIVEHAHDDDRPDQRQEPNQLALRDLLGAVVELRAPNAESRARLETQNDDDDQQPDPFSAMHSGRNVRRRTCPRKSVAGDKS